MSVMRGLAQQAAGDHIAFSEGTVSIISCGSSEIVEWAIKLPTRVCFAPECEALRRGAS